AAVAGGLKADTGTYKGIWGGNKGAGPTPKVPQNGGNRRFISPREPRGIGGMGSGGFSPPHGRGVRGTDKGVQPQSFKSSGGDPNKSIQLSYDWELHKVTGVYEGTQVSLPLTPQVQDDGSVQLALMVELLAGRTPPTVQLIDKNSVREY